MQNSHTSMNSSNQQLHQQQQGDNLTYTQHDDSSMYATDLNDESDENVLCTDSNCEQNYDHQNYENQHSNGKVTFHDCVCISDSHLSLSSFFNQTNNQV